MQKQTELLAPAGNLEAFWAAVEKKADAVYIGWSDFNARVQAENFSLQDISRMIPFAHKHGVKVYIALNILLKERDLPEIVEGLRILEGLSPDALIIQDMGLYYLIKRYFPAFRLHASTLMTIHNHPGAEHLRGLGFQRVVLARELSIDEISAIHRHSPIELEVFVQGALCYSFSGLCLMSSYLGGKSGMRGRCVQPCRRLYESGKKHGSFFSMNDLSAIRLLPELKKAGVTSIKLEGRMRSAHYVSSIVEAYRTALDAPEGAEEALGR
ncbi:MAG: peptidase U32 family protein, partial [Deltaproteobacteria bacterium]|nr:peptidase U32 family protein [Deltaproteobacteria bacterium]